MGLVVIVVHCRNCIQGFRGLFGVRLIIVPGSSAG